MPFINGDGHFTGPDAVVANVFMQLAVHYDGLNVSVTKIFADGDRVALVVYMRIPIKSPGILSKPTQVISGQ